MPLINGMKMACEPCIRGHRSTKCTHASERLMVPVKKPGRPLSSCPHLHNELCGCSSVTAAIPRKSQCGCGTSKAVTPPTQVRPISSPAVLDVSSPTKSTFKVQKLSRPSSRKQSVDMDNLMRMDPGSVNILPYSAPRPIAPALPNGYGASVTNMPYSNDLQGLGFANMPLMQPVHGLGTPFHPSHGNGHFPVTNGSHIPNGYMPLQSVAENAGNVISPPQEKSCCAPKQDENDGLAANNESTTVNGSVSVSSCCSSKTTPSFSKHSSISSEGSPASHMNNGLSLAHDQLYQNTTSFPLTQPLYAPYLPQTTVYAYPPSYGSYQQPLEPSTWRQSVMANMYAQPQPQIDGLGVISAFDGHNGDIPNLDTLHSCGCGDSCQCIGCAAHPYNDATQDYIRSAMKLNHDPGTPTSNDFTNFQNGQAFSNMLAQSALNGNANGFTKEENLSSPITGTPSDNGTAEEQTLSANDFFFVNYPFSGDGCGGDTNTCPCGDDCACLGCAIHRPYGDGLEIDGFTPEKEDGSDDIKVKIQDDIPNEPKKSCCQ